MTDPDADALEEYRSKRHFDRTAEPSGEADGTAEPGAAAAAAVTEPAHRPLFVVQKHDASRLHYDFRLELDGVLKSWAVPKGPSLDPGDKRLAVMVEDHPLEYGAFEGGIPEGEYGAGTVMVWDSGWWEPDEAWIQEPKGAGKKTAPFLSPAEALAKGELKFVIHGEKLKGSWALVKTRWQGENNWLLIKHRDEAARPGSNIEQEAPDSVATGRSLEQIGAESEGEEAVRILVSGASGFVGSAITRHLLDAGHQVRAMSRSTGKAMTVFAGSESGRRGLADGRLTFSQADVTKPPTLVKAVAEIDVVVQAAQFSNAPVEDPGRGLTYMNVDRNGTMNLLEAIAQVYGGVAAPRFLYMSGITVSPASPYVWDRAKWQAEEAIRAAELEWTIVRCSPMYGEHDASFNRLVHYSDYLPFVPVFGDGQAPLTPLSVEDTGRFFALLVDNPERCRRITFGLGGPEVVSLDQFLQLILRAMGRARPILHVPKPVGRIQGAFMQFLPGRPLTPAAVDFVAQAGAVTEVDREWLAEKFPEFRTTPIREGLESYLRT